MAADPKMIGRYPITARLGRGGMGVVYRGVHPTLGSDVAIKVMSSDFSDDEEARTRFFREAKAAANLQHRNIVTIFDFVEEDDGTCYIVMEFLRGKSLADLIKSGTSLSLSQKLEIVAELCTGLDLAHQNGVIHRDVKPANVWILDDGHVKLLDFGIAKTSSSTLTRAGDVSGSAAYMAPEQARGLAIDGRADVFSAAVVLYELVTGRKPFAADSPTATILQILEDDPPPPDQIVPDLPPDVVATIAKGLAKRPSDRYQTAGEFAADLRMIGQSLPPDSDASDWGPPQDPDETGYQPVPLPPRPVPGPRPGPSPRPGPAPIDPAAGGGQSRTGLWLGLAGLVVIGGIGTLVWLNMQKSPALVSDPKPAAKVLHIASDPNGAKIIVDDKDTQRLTPDDITYGDQAPRKIHLTKTGYQPADILVAGKDLTLGSVSRALEKDKEVVAAPATVSVRVHATGPYDFDVSDGDRVLSSAKSTHDFSVQAPRALWLRNSEYLLDLPVKIDAANAPTKSITVPELGTITILSAPVLEHCEIFMKGKSLGSPPINNKKIAPGSYTVQTKCPDGRAVAGQPVTVDSGQPSKVIVKVQ
jgi:serine/threonine-protein kinase